MKNFSTAQSIRFSANLAKSYQAGSQESHKRSFNRKKFSGSNKLVVLKKKHPADIEDFESLLRQEFLADKVKLNFEEKPENQSQTDVQEQKTIQFLHDFWA